MNKILIIEDDKILLEMYKDEFINKKFSVQTANDGQEGIVTMKTSTPDVVLLDLIMPKINGYEFLKLVKANPTLHTIPIIVLTNIYSNSEDLINNWGVKAVLLKSDHTPESIVTNVKQVLGQQLASSQK